jgi:Bax protein
MTFIFKSVGHCARRGRVYLQPAWSCVQAAVRRRSYATASILPGRFPFRGLPFLLLAGALIISIMSCQETGILSGQHTAGLPFASNAGSQPAPAPSSNASNSVYEPQFYSLSVQSSQELIDQLKEFKLWNDIQAEIPPVALASFPADLKQIDVDLKKKTFLRALLPSVMIVQTEVRQERQELLRVIDEIGEPVGLKFSPSHPGWQEGISRAQVLFINDLCKKYRTQDAAELIVRVNILPTSLMLAQAAIESSWGSSRFSIQANNLFGMWTWGEKGLIPARREAGKTHKIAIYDSIADSIRSYLLTINRLGAYSGLREIRSNTMEAEAIAEGLINYSERKGYYVSSLKRLMKRNNLTNFDKCRLALPVKMHRSVRA